MKKLNIKKALSASLAALTLCSAIAFVKPNVKAYAAQPFIADTNNNGAYNIDESQIKVAAKRYFPTGVSIAVKTSSNGVISTAGTYGCTLLDRRVFSFVIEKETDYSFTNYDINKLKNMTLTVTYYIKGKKNTTTYENPTVTKVNANQCYVDFNVITRGDSYSFQTSVMSVTRAKCTGASNGPAADCGNYYKVTADTPDPDGENIVASIRYDSSVKTEYLLNWAKRICVYANALRQTTGVKLDTLYICFDYPTDIFAFNYNGDINSAGDLLGFVGLSPSATSGELNRMAKGNNEITWCMMHEIAHSYGVLVTPSAFNDKFYPGDDDFYCNARGITAIQNCDNLRSTKIYHSGNGGTAIATYDQILNKINMSGFGFSDKTYYTYAKKLVDIGKKYGWEKLEDFFAAKSVSRYTSAANKAAAEAVKELIGKDYTTDDNYLRLVNAFRTLYSSCTGHTAFDKPSFQQFVISEIGVDLVKDIATLKGYKETKPQK